MELKIFLFTTFKDSIIKYFTTNGTTLHLIRLKKITVLLETETKQAKSDKDLLIQVLLLGDFC